MLTAPPAIYIATTGRTSVGALRPLPGDRTLQIFAAVVFPLSVIPLVVLVRRRKALKLSGWLAVALFISLAGVALGCGSSFKNMGGTTTAGTPAGTYLVVVTASGTDSAGNQFNLKSFPFGVTVTTVQ